MKLQILAIGRLKAGPESTLYEDYAKRAKGLGRSCGITELIPRDFPESKLAEAPARMTAESKVLAEACPPSSFIILLDERGQSLSSDDFAGLIRNHLERGTPNMCFLLGGPDGHGAELRGRASVVMSFGPMTWPHRLARVMLAEQIYRAVTILVKHPYHRV